MLYSNLDVSEMFVDRQSQRSSMHARYLSEQLVRVLKTIGYDVVYQKCKGQYLYDRDGTRYLDLLSGFGVFAIGRNHPALRQALKSVLDSDLPNLVQLDVSTLAGVLAERLLEFVPYLDKVFFANSGAECVEAAIKFARGATGRPGIVYCAHAFHGLSYGGLSLTDDPNFRAGFEPLLPGCTSIPFNDLAALEQALSSREVAAFIVEPIQGKGVNMPSDEFLPGAAALCRKYGTLFVADEIQTGMGRTGRFLAVEHWNVEPDIVLLSKALSGGHVPVGALLTRKSVFDKIFNQMDRAVVQGSQDPHPGLRPRQPHHQAVAAADDHGRGLQLDRDGVRQRHRLQSQGPRRDLVAGQDAGGQRGAEVGVSSRSCRPAKAGTHS